MIAWKGLEMIEADAIQKLRFRKPNFNDLWVLVFATYKN
jgi:hypothetical protein